MNVSIVFSALCLVLSAHWTTASFATTLPETARQTCSLGVSQTPHQRYVSSTVLFSTPTKKERSTESKIEEAVIEKNTSAYTVDSPHMHQHSDEEMIVDQQLIASNFDPTDNRNYVVVGSENAKKDPVLRLMSSEVSIKNLVGKEDDPAFVAQSILYERTLDTIEDILVHLRRYPYELGWNSVESPSPNGDVSSPPSKLDKRRTVVILGSGWASHALMKVADCTKLRLIVVSPSNHFVFTPMLASAAVGTVEYRSMTEAVRSANPMIDSFIEGTATDVDVRNKIVSVSLNSLLKDTTSSTPPNIKISYDTLVVGVGTRVADANVPGAAMCLKLKSCDDARRLRTALGECFEYASRPDVATESGRAERSRRVTFLIVGGGPTGVELAGELSDFAQDITKKRVGAYPKLGDSIRVILVHGGKELLSAFEEDMRKEALRALNSRGIEVFLHTRVTEVKDGYVLLSTKKLDENGNPTTERVASTLPVGLTVWCAGNAPVPFVSKMLSELPASAVGSGGRINVDRWLRPPMPEPELLGSILVLGDAASFEDKKQSFLPQTAQVAGQQGAYAARLLCRGYDLTATPPVLPILEKTDIEATNGAAGSSNTDELMTTWLRLRNLERAAGFSFLNLGLLAYVGGGKALSQVQIGDVPIFSYAGSVAFVLWRSVYLVKQVATRNRVLVTFDWIKSALFGRDVTRL